MSRKRVVIMGAAGRDFHNFNVLFRGNPSAQVVAFTATQIPNIDGRVYPAALAGAALYPRGVPIRSESELESIVKGEAVDVVVFAYSDVTHEHVMHLASRVTAWGAEFSLASAQKTMLRSCKPVIAVTACRTGAGKSQTTRCIALLVKRLGKKAVMVRHPMPYGDLEKQACQRFAGYEDLDAHNTTIEEREEYEPLIDHGFVVYAGVDYEKILRQVEQEADVVVWDGGNNDSAFFKADLYITVVDPHRAGHEVTHHPGEANVLLAHAIVVNKCNDADPKNIALVESNCRAANPKAEIVRCRSRVTASDPARIRGRRALIVEDGPTLTHGGMQTGAAYLAARESGASAIVDPVPFAVGSMVDVYKKYPNAKKIVPAMGYGGKQVRELEAMLNKADADVVVNGSPIRLQRVLSVNKPVVDVKYELEEIAPGRLEALVRRVLEMGPKPRL